MNVTTPLGALLLLSLPKIETSQHSGEDGVKIYMH